MKSIFLLSAFHLQANPPWAARGPGAGEANPAGRGGWRQGM